MREFVDPLGSRWNVVVGRESYGTFVLLFDRRDAPETRRLVLAPETAADAERELEELTDEELQARLAQSEAWDGE
jgi:hypothetical protein